MKVGYIRVCTGEDEEIQRVALRMAGAQEIFTDWEISASSVLKPAYWQALRAAKGGELLVWRMDRLASTLGTLLVELQLLERLEIAFSSLCEGISSAPGGEFFGHMRALAGFGRDARAARALPRPALPAPPAKRRRKAGQAPLIGDDKWREYLGLMEGPSKWTVRQVAAHSGLSRQAIYKRLKREV